MIGANPRRILAGVALGALLAMGGGVATLPAQKPAAAVNLLQNGDFSRGEEGWGRYEVFPNSDPVRTWNYSIAAGEARIVGQDHQLNARVGIRSNGTTLALNEAEQRGVFEVSFRWRGEGVHRCGAFVILMDGKKEALLQAEEVGPTGDFDSTVTMPLLVPRGQLKPGGMMRLYFFQDGKGTLTISEAAIQRREGTEGAGWKLEKDRFGKNTLVEAARPRERFPLPEADSLAAMLPGERRLYALPKGFAVPTGFDAAFFRTEERRCAVQRAFTTVRPIAFWLLPEPDAAKATHVELTPKQETGVVLPALPAGRDVMMYFWGESRFGKKKSDVDQDRAAMRYLRSLGVTGLAVQDNYGLDFDRLKVGKLLDGTNVKRMAELYVEAEFTSPMMYLMACGMDRGSVNLRLGDAAGVQAQIKDADPFLREAATILGPRGLHLGIVDEPHEEKRRALAAEALVHWGEKYGADRLVTTGNWKTLEVLKGKTRRWIGAGDYPSYAAVQEAGIEGFYRAVEPRADSLQVRRMAGLHAWASRIPSQAYWHTSAIAGKGDTDLDGKYEDFQFIRWDAASGGHQSSLFMRQLQEGVQDLRLLLALEERAERLPEAAAFLTALRARIPVSDRPTPAWDDPAAFEAVRSEAVRLLRKTH